MSLPIPEERLVFFSCGESSLAGVLTIPFEPSGRTVLIPWGSSTIPSSGPNRIRARLARTLAAQGFHAFRFDYRGVGESDGDYPKRTDLAEPRTEEIIAACAWLTTQDLGRVILVANCFGGWSSLMAAPMIAGLEGVAVVNAPVRRDHEQVLAGDQSWRWWVSKLSKMRLSKLRSPARRALYRKLITAKTSSIANAGSTDSRFRRAAGYLLDHRIPMLLLYGTGDFRVDLESELDRGLRTAIERAGSPTRLVTVPERFEGWSSLGVQDRLVDQVVSWLEELP